MIQPLVFTYYCIFCFHFGIPNCVLLLFLCLLDIAGLRLLSTLFYLRSFAMKQMFLNVSLKIFTAFDIRFENKDIGTKSIILIVDDL